ncbi:hypothetical protein [Orrella sp. 11846]|uniref:hypothetical protein n=1 Tax=Orrella sp. 11846 TaxID=3409913 RepID=UPI003B59FF43
MLDSSFFVSDVVHTREVELADGSTHTLHFKELPAGVFRRFALDNQNDNEDVRVDSMARIVAAGLVTPEGKPALTFEQAKRLKAEPMLRIFEAIQEVNAPDPKVTTSGDSGTS